MSVTKLLSFVVRLKAPLNLGGNWALHIGSISSGSAEISATSAD